MAIDAATATILLNLADKISEAMNSEDEIDRVYLLEAAQEDIRRVSVGRNPTEVQNLIDNPVS